MAGLSSRARAGGRRVTADGAPFLRSTRSLHSVGARSRRSTTHGNNQGLPWPRREAVAHGSLGAVVSVWLNKGKIAGGFIKIDRWETGRSAGRRERWVMCAELGKIGG